MFHSLLGYSAAQLAIKTSERKHHHRSDAAQCTYVCVCFVDILV